MENKTLQNETTETIEVVKTETEIAIEQLESSLAFYKSEVARNEAMVAEIKEELSNLK